MPTILASQDLGAALKAARKQLVLTQPQLAIAAGERCCRAKKQQMGTRPYAE